jgi:hypothetical protein
MARDYHIQPEGNGFQVRENFSNGRVRITGRFLSKSNVQLWIDEPTSCPLEKSGGGGS